MSQYKIRCNSEEFKSIQDECFKSGITLPNGKTEHMEVMGNDHYVFIDNEFIWVESSTAFEIKDDYTELTLKEITPGFFDNNVETIKLSDDVELNEFTEINKSELVTLLLNGHKLVGKSFAKNYYICFDPNETAPYRFVNDFEKYNKPMSESIWSDKQWKDYVEAERLTIEEIEARLGYLIEIVEKDDEC